MPVGRTICALQDGDERAQAQRLLSLLPPKSLCLFDRGFPSYGFLHALHQHPYRYVMRCPATSTFPAVEAFARSGRAETYLWLMPSDTFRRHLTPPQRRLRTALRLRAFRLVAPDGTVSVLLTNLVDPHRFPVPPLSRCIGNVGPWKRIIGTKKPFSILSTFIAAPLMGSGRNSSRSCLGA